jgi:hypothetical protein
MKQKNHIVSLLSVLLGAAGGLTVMQAQAQPVIPTTYAYPASAADTTKPGFIWRASQVASVGSDSQNSNQRTEDQLLGLLGPNIADPTVQGIADAPGVTNANPNLPIIFTISTVINLDKAGGSHGTFTPDDQEPGTPGTNGGTDNQACDALTYLSLPAGTINMGVNSDDGFRVTIGGQNPLDPFAVKVGEFDGGRGAADTTFSFTIQKAGLYAARLTFENGGGDSNVEWWTVKSDGTTRVLVNDVANGGTPAYRAANVAAAATFTKVVPAPGSAGVSPNVTFDIELTDGGNSITSSSIALKVDGAAVTATVVKTGAVNKISFTPAALYTSGSSHAIAVTYTDGTQSVEKDFSFTVSTYVTLPTSAIVTADTSKPGFLWEMSQVDDIGTDTQNSNQRTKDQLAGLLGPNVADPNAAGVATGPGVVPSDPNLPIEFQIPSVINLSKTGGTTLGNFTPDDQMPGSPGTEGGTDNQAARIVTYVDLPAGLVSMGVNSDDGFLTQAGFWNDAFTQSGILGQFDGGRGASTSSFFFVVPQAGTYALFTLFENGGGDSNIEWFTVKPDGTQVLLNDSTNGGYKAYRALAGGPKNVAVGRTVSPAPGAIGVDPIPAIHVELVDGATPIDKSTVSLKLDDVAVPATISKSSNVTTIVYAPTNLFASLSSHSATLLYTEAGTQVSRPWQFTIAKYNAVAKDSVNGYMGFLLGNAVSSPDAGGHTGKAGDKAVDFGLNGNAWVNVLNPSFLNSAASNDVMTFSLWVKKYDIANGSAFWADSPTAGRAFQAHTPWSDDVVYFDTDGCCDGSSQRINANINTLPAYTAVGNDGYWTNWHHFVFLKNAADKQIWIDGTQFLDGSSSNPLPTDINKLWFGTDNPNGGDFMHGLVDDFAIFTTAVSAANIGLLAKGTLPTALTGEKLMAYWNFEDLGGASGPPPTGPHIDAITVAGTSLNVTWTGGGSLQQTTVVGAGANWTDVAGATASPATVPISTNKTLFIRVKM